MSRRDETQCVTCKRTYENNNHGQWTFPSDVREHEIVCLEAHEKNPYVIKQCEDLKEKYYDETVNVSFCGKRLG